MEPLRISSAEAREMFGDSDSENGDDFEGFLPEDIDGHPVTHAPGAGPALADDDFTLDSDSDNEVGPEDTTFADCWWLRVFDRPVGPANIPPATDDYGLFRSFFSDDLVADIVTETNRYAEQIIATQQASENGMTPHSYAAKWTEVGAIDIRAFLGILLIMGFVKLPSYAAYWTTNSLIEMKGLKKVMSRNRFLAILTFFHLNNNESNRPRDHPNHDKLFKIRPLLGHLLTKWQLYFNLKRECSVDESIIAFKGRTSMTQYMPNKPHKWGLKAWCLADSKTGYMYNLNMYTGKETVAVNETRGATHRVVMDVISPILDRGHIFYMDNYFTSPALFKDMIDRQTGACGTLRVNRTGVPASVKTAKIRANAPAQFVRDDNILYVSWTDKRQVNLATSVHNSETFQKQVRSKQGPNHHREVTKPKAVEMYTRYMGGVDRADQQLCNYLSIHRTIKWWKKMFVYLLEVTFQNVCVISKSLKVGQKHQPDKVRLAIIGGLVEEIERTNNHPGRRPDNPASRLTERNFVRRNPAQTAAGRQSMQDCVVCSSRPARDQPAGSAKRHQTQFWCPECEKPLCPFPCFEKYHTLTNYKVVCTKELHT